MKSARETVDIEREQALRDMKSQVASLAMEAARKVLMDEGPGVGGRTAYDQFLKEAGDPHDRAEE